ncbi:hypothetical protein UPYG_G00239240 [Umbra pygmaea]|uniref:Uncharacterized protein n=1 Tax=Umbra pygmaea TaxID=75934 RepID=A0ABD0WEY6_UMBPY
MSKTIYVFFLLAVMFFLWCDNPVFAAKWTFKDVRSCRCKVLLNGRESCHKPLFPQKKAEKMELQKCICSLYNLNKLNSKIPSAIQKKCANSNVITGPLMFL